jgi:SAM-dependent methyltransferase
MGLRKNSLDEFARAAPDPQGMLDLFRGEWSSRLPPPWDSLSAGTAPLFEDPRIRWADERLGGFRGRTVLELGPLEGGHTYMIEQAGATRITAVEANGRAFLKCLVVKELLGLPRARFLHGDFLLHLEKEDSKADLLVACGVLYHLREPVRLIELAARASDRLFLWTQYFDEALVAENPGLAGRFGPTGEAEHRGFRYRTHPQDYGFALNRRGFRGGSAPSSVWMEREDILGALRHFGFHHIEIGFDEPRHPHGPAFAVAAWKDPNPPA